MTHKCILSLAVAALVLLLPVGLFSQATDGNITGTVMDSTGAVIPGASVELENVATGVRRTAEADATGIYRFNNVAVGTYRIVARAEVLSDSVGIVAQAGQFACLLCLNSFVLIYVCIM